MCILFPKIMTGMINWCFYQKPESLQCQYEISITLTNLTFFSPLLVVGLYFPLKCIWLCSHCTAMRGAPKFFLGHNPNRGVLLESTRVKHFGKPFFFLPCDLTQLIVLKVHNDCK